MNSINKKNRGDDLVKDISSKLDFFKKGMQQKPIYNYTFEEQKEYDKFINENFGIFTNVWHELYSPDIHLDILIIPPSKDEDYYKLITKGMGAYKMNVPDIIKNQNFDRAELVMYLPSNWNFDFKKEENYWVVRQMKLIARTAIEENSWVGFGHTFSGNEKATIPFAKNTQLSSTVLLYSLNKDFEYPDFNLKDKGKINFYQIFPLYKEELEYKQSHSTQELMKLFSDEDLFPIVNINRKNYCEKNIQKEISEDKDLDNIEK